jgi:hypothetical protein
MMQELVIKYRPWLEGEKIEVLFMFQAGTVWPSLESVYESCVTDERFSVRLVLMTEVAVETSHMAGAQAFLEDRKLPYERYEDIDFYTYCPHVVFIQFPYDAACHTPDTLSIQFRKRGTRVIYVPYGIEISDTQISRKDHFHSFVVENAWRVYTCCEGIKEEYNKYCHNRHAVRALGSPKFDAISHKESLPLNEEITRQSKGKKIIVWKMHFPKKIVENGRVYQITPYMQEYIAFARDVDQYDDLFFVVMAHPKMLRGVVASDIQGDDSLMKQVAELLQILSTKRNVFIDREDDYRNSFYHADAIMMDRSAVMIEAAMLDVPVLLMKNQDYSEPMTAPVDHVVSTFLQGSVCADMMSFVEAVRRNEDTNAVARRKAVVDNMPFGDGLCGERIKNDIAAGLREEPHLPRVVLYGTGEICRYYMEKQHWNHSAKFDLTAIADSAPAKWGTEFFGVRILSPEQLKELEFDAVVIMTEPHYFEIKKSLVYDYDLDERRIWRLDEFVAALDEG